MSSLVLAVLLFMQVEQSVPMLHEIGVYGGASLWAKRDDVLHTTLIDGGLFGVRFTQNAWRRVSLEETMAIYGVNNLRFNTLPSTDLGARIFQLGVGPLFNFTSRESRVRPFVTGGYQTNIFYPTDKAKKQAAALPNAITAASLSGLKNDRTPAMFYGAGFRVRMTPGGRVALRLDARGILSGWPRFGLESGSLAAGSITMAEKPKFLNGLQSTIGLTFYLGRAAAPPAPAPRAAEPAAAPAHTMAISEIRGAAEVCPGAPVLLSVSPSMGPENYPLTYQWTVDGAAAGPSAAEFSYTAPSAPGEHRIALTVRDSSGAASPAAAVTRDAVLVRVKPYGPPTVTASADRSDVKAGDVVNLTAKGTASDCGGNLTYSWSSSEGNVTGGAAARFDSSSVSFDRANRDRLQTKTVTLTATARDEKSGMATAPVTLRVALDPEARRFDDIVFAQGGSRVNNCGKRILLDEVYSILTSNPNYDLVLVGHIDEKEAPRRPAPSARQLDRERVLSAAGVVAGNGLESSRIKTDWVGTDASSETRPGFCGTSTRVKTVERQGQTVSDADQAAKNQRVEVWLVPKGAPMPGAVKAAKDLPANFRAARRQ